MRDILVELATTGLFRAKWTSKIHEEWIEAVLKQRPDLLREKLERTKTLMNEAVDDCLIENYEEIVPSLSLPDENDRHVLAAAIVGRCDAIVTFNRKDFPKDYLAKFVIDVQHPDEFIYNQFGLCTAEVVVSAQRVRTRLTRNPQTQDEYLETLERQGLPLTVSELAKYKFSI